MNLLRVLYLQENPSHLVLSNVVNTGNSMQVVLSMPLLRRIVRIITPLLVYDQEGDSAGTCSAGPTIGKQFQSRIYRRMEKYGYISCHIQLI